MNIQMILIGIMMAGRIGGGIKEEIGMRYGMEKNQEMDIHIPDIGEKFPIVIFAHGGCWDSGDKVEYRWLGRYLARNGIGCINLNYRLVPEVKYKEQARDIVSVMAWVKGNYVGHRVYLMGHSAGGHLISLVACDRRYLLEVGLSEMDIGGVISFSGIYDINWALRFYGIGGFEGLSKKEASPLQVVDGRAPKFLIIYGEKDIVTLGKQARSFHNKLVMKGCKSKIIVGKGKDHSTIIDGLIGSSYIHEIFKFLK